MDSRTWQWRLVLGLNAARTAVGVALLLAPRRIGRLWFGPVTDQRAVLAALRSLAARDAALGAGTLLTLRRHGPVRVWLEAGMVSDLADGAASLAASSALPPLGRVLVPLASFMAATAGALGSRTPAGRVQRASRN